MAAIDIIAKPFKKVFGTRNDRLVKAYRRRAEEVGESEGKVRAWSDAELRVRSGELRDRVRNGEDPEKVLPEAYALMRESLDRNVGIRNIFNPLHVGKFALDQLPMRARELYASVEREIAGMSPEVVPGQLEPVPSWLRVEIPVELYEAVREMLPESRPPFRCRPFDVQLIGGMVLHEGKIAEMKTGEGKTIVAPLACYMAVIEGMRCHVVTVNDYLVQRDRDWVFPAFYALGVTVGAIHPIHMQPEPLKQRMYGCDIVYGTNSEFGFDFLRDNMKLTLEEQVQRRREFCIVDEIDSILIDEARTPLIISGAARDDAPQYLKANEVAESLVRLQGEANRQTGQRVRAEGFVVEQARLQKQPEAVIEKVVAKFRDLGPEFLDEKEGGFIGHTQYYVVRRESHQATMTHLGVEEAQKLVGTRFYVVGNDMGWDHLINNAVRAHTVYERDREYVVQEGEVVIVDENTGRLMIGRQWSDGLHQAVEAKESRHGVKIKRETQTLATITIQNFFKLYKRLAGMTGTAATEATEFYEIYKLDVVQIPTNVSVIREDSNDLIYLTEKSKWDAILEEIREKCEAGRPVLVGTTSVEKSEGLSKKLEKKHGIEHEVLNAKQHEREAHIVEKAGEQHVDNRGRTVGNVTIATNMAGRGTDIKLTEAVRAAGGLHIVGTERHEARRIDNQLRGRAGRQGDPGSSRFFISMEDDLMKIFAGKRTMQALRLVGMKEEDAIEHKWLSRSVANAQRKVEERNFQSRKSLLEYDEVMNYQRTDFYSTRQGVLEGRGVQALIDRMLAESIEGAVGTYLAPAWVADQVSEAIRAVLGVAIDPRKLRGATNLSDVEGQVRSDAKADVRQEIEISVGEYMSEVEGVEASDQDLPGLSHWAMSRFSVDLKVSKISEMGFEGVVEKLTEAAHALIDRKPLEGLSKFFEPLYAESELARWVKEKFAFEVPVEELKPRGGESAGERSQRVAEGIYEKAQAAYRRREVEYPITFALDRAFAFVQQGPQGAEHAARELSEWANLRYEMGFTPETITKLNGNELFEKLRAAGEAWHGAELERWVSANATRGASDAMIAERFAKRWGVALRMEEVGGTGGLSASGLGSGSSNTGRQAASATQQDPRAALVRERALGVMRTELTQLERYVLLQILDQSWKDHLYAMDQMKDSIGLRGFAEKDPKIEYKREGARMYGQMQRDVREKVTDLIFKARLTPRVQLRSVYQQQEAHHDVIESTGATAGMQEEAKKQREDLESAQRAGGGERKVVQTIVNKSPQVGRNSPCPCGSGKKYKHCCGR